MKNGKRIWGILKANKAIIKMLNAERKFHKYRFLVAAENLNYFIIFYGMVLPYTYICLWTPFHVCISAS